MMPNHCACSSAGAADGRRRHGAGAVRRRHGARVRARLQARGLVAPPRQRGGECTYRRSLGCPRLVALPEADRPRGCQDQQRAETTYTIFCAVQSQQSCEIAGDFSPFTFAEGPGTLHFEGRSPGTLYVSLSLTLAVISPRAPAPPVLTGCLFSTADLACSLAGTTAATCTGYSSYADGVTEGRLTGPTETSWTSHLLGLRRPVGRADHDHAARDHAVSGPHQHGHGRLGLHVHGRRQPDERQRGAVERRQRPVGRLLAGDDGVDRSHHRSNARDSCSSSTYLPR